MIGLGKAQGRRLRDTADNDRLYFPAPYAAQFLSDVSLKLKRLDDLVSEAAVTAVFDAENMQGPVLDQGPRLQTLQVFLP